MEAKKTVEAVQTATPQRIPRLKQRFREEVVPTMMQEFSYRNPMEVPRLEKIVLNVGMGEAVQNPKRLDLAMESLAWITGQRPVVTRARRSIAGFKLRAGMPIGCKVTLRGDRMYEFLERLIHVALPRIRDFRGLPGRAFDGRGNYSIGIREQIIFPEVPYDTSESIHGLDITIVTTAETDEEAKSLLKHLGLPIRD